MFDLYNKVMTFMVTLRNENKFDDKLYDEIYDAIESLIEKWKTQDCIPKKAFVSCIYLVDTLAGGSRFLSDEDNVKVEDACNDINELLTQLEE